MNIGFPMQAGNDNLFFVTLTLLSVTLAKAGVHFLLRHPRESGGPFPPPSPSRKRGSIQNFLDSLFRGNDGERGGEGLSPPLFFCHPRENGGLYKTSWIPACAGMTMLSWIPAFAGMTMLSWIPAFAGMTEEIDSRVRGNDNAILNSRCRRE